MAPGYAKLLCCEDEKLNRIARKEEEIKEEKKSTRTGLYQLASDARYRWRALKEKAGAAYDRERQCQNTDASLWVFSILPTPVYRQHFAKKRRGWLALCP